MLDYSLLKWPLIFRSARNLTAEAKRALAALGLMTLHYRRRLRKQEAINHLLKRVPGNLVPRIKSKAYQHIFITLECRVKAILWLIHMEEKMWPFLVAAEVATICRSSGPVVISSTCSRWVPRSGWKEYVLITCNILW